MIVERRAYTFRPGQVAAFWDAQPRWNTEAVFGPIRQRNISYFSTVAGDTDQVVHLYRFESPDQWRDIYDAFYRAQNPDYFALVRPMMVRQENALLTAPPVPGLAADWLEGAAPRLPVATNLPTGVSAATLCVVETRVDFLPGGLPAYWEAWRRHPVASRPPARGARLAVLMTLVGRLHGVYRYEAFASLDDAQAHAAGLAADAAWGAYVTEYSAWVAGGSTRYLRPAPLPSRRSLFETG